MQYAMVAMIADDEFIARYRLDPSWKAQVGDRGVRNAGQHPEKTELEVGYQHSIVPRVSDSQRTVWRKFRVSRKAQFTMDRAGPNLGDRFARTSSWIDKNDPMIACIRDHDPAVRKLLRTMRIQQCDVAVAADDPGRPAVPIRFDDQILRRVYDQHVSVGLEADVVGVVQR